MELIKGRIVFALDFWLAAFSLQLVAAFVPGGIPGIYLGFRWTCNVCVGTNLGVKTKKELRFRGNKLLIPK
jgi:hypothetical protein